MPKKGALRVLLVEDHHDSRAALLRLLERCGHEVCACDCVAAALAEAGAAPFDIVICDIGLPDGDGCDLMRTLRDDHGVSCIAVSGHADDEHARAAAAAGICVHLCKPVDFQKLLDAIDECRPNARQSA
jgi:CheY-like chemotaxis protein